MTRENTKYIDLLKKDFLPQAQQKVKDRTPREHFKSWLETYQADDTEWKTFLANICNWMVESPTPDLESTLVLSQAEQITLKYVCDFLHDTDVLVETVIFTDHLRVVRDEAEICFFIKQTRVELTGKEQRLVSLLLDNQGVFLSREYILENLFTPLQLATYKKRRDSETNLSNIIKNLRKKINKYALLSGLAPLANQIIVTRIKQGIGMFPPPEKEALLEVLTQDVVAIINNQPLVINYNWRQIIYQDRQQEINTQEAHFLQLMVAKKHKSVQKISELMNVSEESLRATANSLRGKVASLLVTGDQPGEYEQVRSRMKELIFSRNGEIRVASHLLLT